MRSAALAALAASLLLIACSDDQQSERSTPSTTTQGPAATASTSAATPAPVTTSLDASTTTTSTDAPSTSTTLPAPTATASTATLPPPPPAPTGVPGLSDPRAVCNDWARFLGSVQILRIAQAFGGNDDAALNRAEVIATSTIAASLRQLGATDAYWPAEIAAERARFEAYTGPYTTRAEHVEEALTAAGATPSQREQIQAAWDDLLQRWNPDDPALQIAALPAELERVVGQAAADIGAKYPTFASDPTIATTQMGMPRTVAWLQHNCPALADVGFGDGN